MSVFLNGLMPSLRLLPPEIDRRTFQITLDFEGEFDYTSNEALFDIPPHLTECSLMTSVSYGPDGRDILSGTLGFWVEAHTIQDAVTEFMAKVEELEFLYPGFLDNADQYTVNIRTDNLVRL